MRRGGLRVGLLGGGLEEEVPILTKVSLVSPTWEDVMKGE